MNSSIKSQLSSLLPEVPPPVASHAKNSTQQTSSQLSAPTRFQLPPESGTKTPTGDAFQLQASTLPQANPQTTVQQRSIQSESCEPPLKKAKLVAGSINPKYQQSVTDKLLAPPHASSTVRFSGVLKKSGCQRRYSNTKLVKGGRGYQVKRTSPTLVGAPIIRAPQDVTGAVRMTSNRFPLGATINRAQLGLASEQLQLGNNSQVTYVQTAPPAMSPVVCSIPHGTSGAVQFQQLSATPTVRSPALQPGHLGSYQSGNVDTMPPPQQVTTTFHTQQGQPIQISIPAYAANASPVPSVLDLTKISQTEARNVGYSHNQLLSSSGSVSSPQLLSTSGYSGLPTNAGMPLRVMSRASNFSAASPQGFTVQYVNNFSDPQQQAVGGQIVTGYQGNSVVVQQPILQQQQLVQPLAPHQVISPGLLQQTVMPPPGIVQPGLVQPPMVQASPVVVPQVVNSNITYTINSPKTYVINQQQPVLQQQQPAVQVIQPGLLQATNPIADNSIHNIQVASSVPQLNQSSQSPALPNLMGCPSLESSSKQYGHQVKVISASEPAMQIINPQTLVNRKISDISLQRQLERSESNFSSTSTNLRPNVSFISSSTSVAATRFTMPPTPSSQMQTIVRHRSPFGTSGGVVRNVATVAPAIINSPVLSSGSRGVTERDDTRNMISNDVFDDVDGDRSGERPRPTYSYRDAMNRPQLLKKKPRSDVLLKELQHHIQQPNTTVQSKMSLTTKPRERKQDFKENSRPVEKDSDPGKDSVITQPYKLVLKRDSANECGFNVLPIQGSNSDLVNHEVKELRIKAKVSLGPKRKKINVPLRDKDVFFAPKDVTHDALVNEQIANLSPPSQNQTSLPDDLNLFDKPVTTSKPVGNSAAEPFIVFELTSEDGFKVESRHLGEVWQTVFDAVNAARASLKIGQQQSIDSARCAGVGQGMSGLHMLGLTHNAVQYLLEQLPGANDCQKYSFQFHRRHREEGSDTGSPSGCVRTESFKSRSPYDLFSWLASQHRRLPETDVLTTQEEIQLSTRSVL